MTRPASLSTISDLLTSRYSGSTTVSAIVVSNEEGLEVRLLDPGLGDAVRSSQKTNRDLFVGDQHIRQPCVYSRSNNRNFLEASGSKNTLGYL